MAKLFTQDGSSKLAMRKVLSCLNQILAGSSKAGQLARETNSDHALFNELSSSPASMEAAKLLDAFGSQPGFSKAQADAIQAYIQAFFTGVPTWLSLPRNRWPKDWEKRYWQPMVPMLLALYGHPDSGGIWENPSQ